MIYALLFMTCQAGSHCLPMHGEYFKTWDQCEAVRVQLPNRKNMKVSCVPILKYKKESE